MFDVVQTKMYIDIWIFVGFILTSKRHSNITEGCLVIFDDDLSPDDTKVSSDQIPGPGDWIVNFPNQIISLVTL